MQVLAYGLYEKCMSKIYQVPDPGEFVVARQKNII
jgi:hypothetical protein